MFEKLGFVSLTKEEEEQYAAGFEKRLKSSRYLVLGCYAVALFGYLTVIMPLLMDQDTHVVTKAGVWITLCAFFLYAILMLELLSRKSILLRTKFFTISPLEYSSMLVMVCVVGGCCQFFGRILNGQCEDGQDSFTCNPYDESGFFPSDAILLIGAFIQLTQLVGCVNNTLIILVSWIPILITLSYTTSRYKVESSASSIMCTFFLFISSVKHSAASKSCFLRTKQVAKADLEALELLHQSQVMEGRVSDIRHIVGNVSHDLKTPMQAFAMEISSLQDHLKDFEKSIQNKISLEEAKLLHECDNSIGIITDISGFMLATISRCLDFTKASCGLALAPVNSTFELLAAIKWAISCIERSNCKDNITLDEIPVDISDYIISDQQWFMENVLCLLSNAVKFGDNVRVCLKLTDSDELLVEVEDDGVGISTANRDLLFQPHRDVQRDVGGSGLGLYCLAKRVECMKGRYGLRNKNNDGSGSCFWFSIPYVPDLTRNNNVEKFSTRELKRIKNGRIGDTKVYPISPSETSFNDSKAQLYGRMSTDSIDEETSRHHLSTTDRSLSNVLVVDDAIVVQKTISRALRRQNFEVSVAPNGQIALDMMKDRRYDVVLMDLQMPVMDGHRAVKNLRKFEAEKGVPLDRRQKVIGMSAACDEETRKEVFRDGMDNFLPKPFSIESFNQICENLQICSVSRMKLSEISKHARKSGDISEQLSRELFGVSDFDME